MSERQVIRWAAAFAAACVLSIFMIDGALAVALQNIARDVRNSVNSFVSVLELVFLFSVSKFASGALLLVIAALIAPARRFRVASWSLAFVGLSQLATRLIAGVLKNVFGRLRPFEALADGSWSDSFFADGSAFPSGHAAHFWGFYFALAMLFPRYRWPLLVLPVLTSIARVVVNDHYLGDVLASAAIAAAVTWAFGKVLLRRITAAREFHLVPSPAA